MSTNVLRQVPLFGSLPEPEIELLGESLQPVEMEADSLPFHEGASESRCYILREGEVDIVKALGTDDERLPATRGQGTSLGEMSLFTLEHRRTASVRARTPLGLLKIRRQDLEDLLRRQQALQSGNGAGADQACEAIWGALQDYQGGIPQEDDVTLLAVGIG